MAVNAPLYPSPTIPPLAIADKPPKKKKRLERWILKKARAVLRGINATKRTARIAEDVEMETEEQTVSTKDKKEDPPWMERALKIVKSQVFLRTKDKESTKEEKQREENKKFVDLQARDSVKDKTELQTKKQNGEVKKNRWVSERGKWVEEAKKGMRRINCHRKKTAYRNAKRNAGVTAKKEEQEDKQDETKSQM